MNQKVKGIHKIPNTAIIYSKCDVLTEILNRNVNVNLYLQTKPLGPYHIMNVHLYKSRSIKLTKHKDTYLENDQYLHFTAACGPFGSAQPACCHLCSWPLLVHF